jgi:hypothetical protein
LEKPERRGHHTLQFLRAGQPDSDFLDGVDQGPGTAFFAGAQKPVWRILVGLMERERRVMAGACDLPEATAFGGKVDQI